MVGIKHGSKFSDTPPFERRSLCPLPLNLAKPMTAPTNRVTTEVLIPLEGSFSRAQPTPYEKAKAAEAT